MSVADLERHSRTDHVRVTNCLNFVDFVFVDDVVEQGVQVVQKIDDFEGSGCG